ncbi:hypothetical protein evm_014377 [Chilo suppressalis]|nr:hypothetical protein evm_014377 [Chilo suppressalis]
MTMLTKKFKPLGIYILVPLYTMVMLLLGASITAGLFVFHVVVVPLIFRYSKVFRRNLVFANFGKKTLLLVHLDLLRSTYRKLDLKMSSSMQFFIKNFGFRGPDKQPL